MSAKILILLAILGLTLAKPLDRILTDEEEETFRNTNAKYQFATNVEDHINDLTNQRSETREGGKVTGMYSYSDGFVRRTIHYEADDKGYRITKQDITPLDGPKVNINGRASVDAQAHGTHLKYTVQSVTAKEPIPKLDTAHYVQVNL